jgi:hypothetical protein
VYAARTDSLLIPRFWVPRRASVIIRSAPISRPNAQAQQLFRSRGAIVNASDTGPMPAAVIENGFDDVRRHGHIAMHHR